jgi:hypothetical protein
MFKFGFRAFSLSSFFTVVFSWRAHSYCREAIGYFYLDKRPYLLKYVYHLLTLVSSYSPVEEKLLMRIIDSIDDSSNRTDLLADGVADLSPLPPSLDLDRATDAFLSRNLHCEHAAYAVNFFYDQCVSYASGIYRSPVVTEFSFVNTPPGALSQSGLWHHDGIGSRLTFWCVLAGGSGAPYLQYLKGSHLISREPLSGFNTRCTSQTALEWSAECAPISFYAIERRIYVLDTNGIHRGVYSGCSAPRLALMLTISDQSKSASLSKISPMLVPLDLSNNEVGQYLSLFY